MSFYKRKRKAAALLCAVMLCMSGCGENAAETAGTGEQDQNTAAEENASESNVDTDLETSIVTGTTDGVDYAQQSVFAMDTYMSLTTYGDKCVEAMEAAVAEIKRLDAMLSVGNEDSEIFRINDEGQGSVSEDTAEMIEASIGLYETTDGAYDITVYPLMELWGFTTGDFRVPTEEEIQEILPSVGTDLLEYDDETRTLSLGKALGVDLGGIAKGFTSTRLMEIFEEYDLVSGMVTLGGNVQCYGTKPDGSQWKIGIQDPNAADSASAMEGVLTIQDLAVITSGAYERNFTDEETGKTYHHIIDPSTGYPADQGIISSTIVSADGKTADGLSTACYVMGLDRSVEYWKQYGESLGFDMILMTDDNVIHITEGLEDSFTSDYDVDVIRRDS